MICVCDAAAKIDCFYLQYRDGCRERHLRVSWRALHRIDFEDGLDGGREIAAIVMQDWREGADLSCSRQ
jgi:hypothetical protein